MKDLNGVMEEATRKVRIRPELMATLFTRDDAGRRLIVDWGEPDAEGFYEPRITLGEPMTVYLLVWEPHDPLDVRVDGVFSNREDAEREAERTGAMVIEEAIG